VSAAGASEPLRGLRVVEISLGLSAVGAGLASSLPGALFRDLGAEVHRLQSAERSTLDVNVEFARVWDRGKQLTEVDLDDEEQLARSIGSLLEDADVAFVSGPARLLEQQGIGFPELSARHPRLIWARIRPSSNAKGAIPDLELLVQARAGLLTQIRGRRDGPTFGDLTVASAGAALCAVVGVLTRLLEREESGLGGWVETSLYDGLLAILPMIMGRVEVHSGATRLLWEQQGPTESLAYRCGDGSYLQLWFGAKGAYEAFLEHMGDEPSEAGYNADLMNGSMIARSARWASMFTTRARDEWLEELAGQPFRCEPVWQPGEALLDEHVRQVGLSIDVELPELGPATVLGPVAAVTPAPASSTGIRQPSTGRLLEGIRVLDLSAYLAGPIAPLILAELGADVVKVEPITGDVHRTMEPMFAAGQRGKRALALDMKSSEAPRLLAELFRWSDVVHHNSRVGLAERLGYDEATVRQANPDAVYSFASGFGAEGPRALLPANDHLMQALSGIEAAQGGPGQPPCFLVWGAIDVTSGWLSAAAVLAGLFARRRSGLGQSVATSLLGAALMLKSGAFVTDEGVLSGPVLDEAQTGYGAAYRLYRTADDAWLALAIPDRGTWRRLVAVMADVALPDEPPVLRREPGLVQHAEQALAAAFTTRSAAEWLSLLGDSAVPVELAVERDRSGFIAGFLDDPVNRQLGRVVSYPWGERGRLEQAGLPLRLGPAARPRAAAAIPGLGEHGAELLRSLGYETVELERLAAEAAIVLPDG
jgi:crotonobetainyl-CoA:carnitine CoA-transferase CaiB-like acyl-CoA transferase